MKELSEQEIINGHRNMDTKKKIYLACPYSHKDPDVRLKRYYQINEIAAKLMQAGQGYIVFSPISHSHPIACQNHLPFDYEYWKVFNESFLDWADEIFIAMLDGWIDSKGIMGEIDYVCKDWKPIRLIDQDGEYVRDWARYDN